MGQGLCRVQAVFSSSSSVEKHVDQIEVLHVESFGQDSQTPSEDCGITCLKVHVDKECARREGKRS